MAERGQHVPSVAWTVQLVPLGNFHLVATHVGVRGGAAPGFQTGPCIGSYAGGQEAQGAPVWHGMCSPTPTPSPRDGEVVPCGLPTRTAVHSDSPLGCSE